MFKKFNSITNHYQTKQLDWWQERFPKIDTIGYVALEKIDGANIQINFRPNQEFKVGKRSSYLGTADNFMGVWDVISRMNPELQRVQEWVNLNDTELTLYGELFGAGIQNRVWYGNDKYILFYDAILSAMSDTYLPFDKFDDLMFQIGLGEYVVPIVAVGNLEDMMECDVDRISHVPNALKAAGQPVGDPSPTPNQHIEGIVIRPMSTEISVEGGSRFILKKKSDKFKEKENKSGGQKMKGAPSEVASDWHNEFRRYINQSRLLSVFSKEGAISSPNQIGDYIRMVIEDAWEEMSEELDVPEMTKAELKFVRNVQFLIVPMLKEYL